jgi:hypothetical protein
MGLSRVVHGMLDFTLFPTTVPASTPPLCPPFNLAATDECCKMTFSLNMAAKSINLMSVTHRLMEQGVTTYR